MVSRIALCILGLSAASIASDISTWLINGKPVDPGTYKEVVRIRSGSAGCTATVVGPRIIATAAHCATNGANATFKVDGVEYQAKITRSPLYPGKDHDIALGLASQEIKGVEPSSVGGKAVTGLGITLLGFGCINPGGGGGNDGTLRVGDTVITGFSGFDMVSRKAGGAALCFGDSGGPAFVVENGKRLLLGINSKGNIKDTNYNSRTDTTESKNFLTNFAQQNSVVICGINSECGTTPPPPVPPTCTLTATPNLLKVGQVVTLSLVASGQATSASIDGVAVNVPTGTRVVTSASAGTFTSRGTVTGPGGDGRCEADYKVENGPPAPPPAPTCTLSAVPNAVKLGESLALELSSQGQVTHASIDGVSVNFPLGKRLITPTANGTFSATATVTGPGGAGNCWTSYKVDNTSPPPPPETPNFAAVPAFCGDNVVLETPVRKVCLAVIKRDSAMSGLRVTEALMINYADTSREVMPIFGRKNKPKAEGDVKVLEELTLYANGSVAAGTYLVLDTRQAVLTKLPRDREGEVPFAIEGRTSKGHYFLVEKLSPYGVSE